MFRVGGLGFEAVFARRVKTSLGVPFCVYHCQQQTGLLLRNPNTCTMMGI